MQDKEKKEITQLVEAKGNALGSFNKAAKFLDVSPGTVSNIRNRNWVAINDKKWTEIGQKLGYKRDNWVISTETRDYRHITRLLAKVKANCSFQIICERAGGSKTTGLKAFANQPDQPSVHYMIAREWGSRVFMTELVATLEVPNTLKKDTADTLLAKIIDHLKGDLASKPMIIIDEADKMKPGALRNLIYLFNELEDRISVVIAGADALRKHLTRGVQYSHLGYDELESRFGRTYMPMIGANKKDVALICNANGVNTTEAIDHIWEHVGKIMVDRKKGKERYHETVVHDLRRLKKLVQVEQMKSA